MDGIIIQKLAELQVAFTHSINTGNPQPFASDWILFQNIASTILESGGLDHDTITILALFSKQVSIISKTQSEIARHIQDAQKLSLRVEREIISAPSFKFLNSTVSASISEINTANDIVSFAPYREFFLTHFVHPYPTASQKTQLLLEVPNHTLSQLSTWFVNARRRSGWQEMFKMYANSDSRELEEVLAQLETSGGREAELSQICREAVAGVKDWFRKGGRDQIGASVREVIAKGLK